VARQNDGVSICTTFLTAPDTVMTNSHCLPEGLKDGSNCDGQIEVLFPASNNLGEARATCKTIVKRSDHEIPGAIASQDFAILKLSRDVVRPSLSISPKNLSSTDALSVVSMNPKSRTTPFGQISTPRKCTILGNNIFSPNALISKNPILFFSECKLIEGNSGSPLLDSEGLVRAIGQGHINRESMKILFKNLIIDDIEDISAGTNFNCADLNAGANEIAPSCKSLPKIEEARAYMTSQTKDESLLRKNLEAEIQNITKEWNKNYIANQQQSKTDYVYWKPQISNISSNRYNVIPVPSCFREPSSWLKSKFEKGFFGYQKTASETYSLSQFVLTVGLNKYLEFEYKITSALINLPFELTYSPSRFDSAKVTNAEVQVALKTISSEEIGVCPSI
jgi:V8-like Glu-specific endopeptidase